MYIFAEIIEKNMTSRYSKRKNKFLHAFYNDLQKVKPDKLDLEVHGDTTPPNLGFKVDAEYIKKQKMKS